MSASEASTEPGLSASAVSSERSLAALKVTRWSSCSTLSGPSRLILTGARYDRGHPVARHRSTVTRPARGPLVPWPSGSVLTPFAGGASPHHPVSVASKRGHTSTERRATDASLHDDPDPAGPHGGPHCLTCARGGARDEPPGTWHQHLDHNREHRCRDRFRRRERTALAPREVQLHQRHHVVHRGREHHHLHAHCGPGGGQR